MCTIKKLTKKASKSVQRHLTASGLQDCRWICNLKPIVMRNTRVRKVVRTMRKPYGESAQVEKPKTTYATKEVVFGNRQGTRPFWDHFGDDELPRPPGLQRIAKSQRSGSNSTASSGSNPVAYQEFMAEQYDLDHKAKMQVLSQESEYRRRMIQAQKIAEDMKVLQIDTSGMDPTYAAIINAQKERIIAEYLPPN
ncbi:hypothetical protein Tco_0303269 [Tanacetum coccineum]